MYYINVRKQLFQLLRRMTIDRFATLKLFFLIDYIIPPSAWANILARALQILPVVDAKSGTKSFMDVQKTRRIAKRHRGQN